MGGTLTIGGNASLTSLDGRPSLTTVTWLLLIQDNACLSQAEAEAFAAFINVDGAVTVSGNGADFPCN